MIAATIAVFALIGWMDFPELFQKKETGKILVLAFLFLSALVTAILLCAGVRLPSPILWIERTLRHFGLSF